MSELKSPTGTSNPEHLKWNFLASPANSLSPYSNPCRTWNNFHSAFLRAFLPLKPEDLPSLAPSSPDNPSYALCSPFLKEP